MSVLFIGYTAAVIWIILPFAYWVTAPDWHKTRTGRALMYLLGSTAALFALLITGGLFGAYPGREIVRGVVYAGVLLAGLRLVVLFIMLRRDLARLIRAEKRKQEMERAH